MPEIRFTPKDGGPDWVARISEAHGTGYDVVLFLDVAEGQTQTSGWMLELAIIPGAGVVGQITSKPGSESIASFVSNRESLIVTDLMSSQPDYVVLET